MADTPSPPPLLGTLLSRLRRLGLASKDALDRVALQRMRKSEALQSNPYTGQNSTRTLEEAYAQLGVLIRDLVDENHSHRAFREADRQKIRTLTDEVVRAVAGTPDEALAIEINEKVAT